MSEPRKNLSSFFHRIKKCVEKSAIKKKVYSAMVQLFTQLFSQIYTEWKTLIGFAYSSTPVGFRVILMSFLSFLIKKSCPREFLRPEAFLSRSYLRKWSIWSGPPMKHFFFLATIATINVKMSFTHFCSKSCQGNIFRHQNHATY